MSQLVRRVERLESLTDRIPQRSVLVFSEEEAEAIYQELGPDVYIIRILPL